MTLKHSICIPVNEITRKIKDQQLTAYATSVEPYKLAAAGEGGVWEALLRLCRVGLRQTVVAFALLLAVVFVRAPMRAIPDALFLSDGFGYYIYLPSLVIDRDLDLGNQLAHVPYEAQKSYFNEVPKTGLRADPFPIGPAVLWLPFFLVGHLAAVVLRALGAPVGASGFGYAYELPTYCGAFLYGVAGLWLIQRLVSEMFSKAVANLTTFAMLFCTPYAYYLWIEPDMSHVSAAFSIALFMYAAWRAMKRDDATIRTWAGVGATLGLVALVRPYNGLIAAAALPAVWSVCRARRGAAGLTITRLMACAAAAAVVFLPQVVVATLLYGQLMFLPPGTGYDEMMWRHPNFIALAVSIFSFFPLLLVSFAGLIAFRGSDGEPHEPARDAYLKWVRPAALVALVAVMYIVASYPRGSTFGDSFGQRRIVDWSALLGLGFATCMAAVPAVWQRRLAKAVVVVAAVTGVITVLYVLKILPQWGMAGLFV